MGTQDDQILVGMNQIKPLLGGMSDATIIKWKKEYPSMPMRKIGNQWTTYRDEMQLWWHHYVTDTLDAYKPAKEKPKRRLRVQKTDTISHPEG